MTSTTETLYKCVVVGDSGVGKSSVCQIEFLHQLVSNITTTQQLIQRYSQNAFDYGTKPTIGVDFAMCTIQTDDNRVFKAQIWDTVCTTSLVSLRVDINHQIHI
jgi:GTPase SAR1 family protein